MNIKPLNFTVILLLTVVLNLSACAKNPCGEGIGGVKDEALCVERTAESLSGAAEDYFRDMDYGITKNAEEVRNRLNPYLPGISAEDAVTAAVKGRNNWIVWTAGNDRLWDEISRRSVGGLDFLKTLSSHPDLKAKRSNRWYNLGLVNEPCFKQADSPREDRYGLWLDVRVESDDCPPDPFENESKYPGVKIGARGNNIPAGSYYGYASGIVGLRLFPNPDFDEKAEKNWKPKKYYTDPDYYKNKDLIKPYRVGMSCGFCHVGPNPTNPPADPENPKWANLNSNPGAQYFWVDRIFNWEQDASSFPFQLFHTSRPGTLDTSFISNDYINNPRTMNAIYSLGARLKIAKLFGQETLTDGNLNNAQFNEYVMADSPLNQFFQAPDTVWTPRVLKDGSDSVGALGALNRVYINIGLFSEEWLQHFRPLVGGKKITPIKIEVARKNSSYWKANEMQTPDLAAFFLASAQPDYLKNAPGGGTHLTNDDALLTRGKEVFADRCARCHSSKLPNQVSSFFPPGANGKNYLEHWNEYWTWTKTAEFKQEMQEIVLQDGFLQDNFLSTEFRIPVTLLETNACSPLATNAIEDNVWDNFSSRSYKDLPSVGIIQVHDPYTGERRDDYQAPAGGVGYTRPASLISLWSSAPFLLNNSLGEFYWSGTVEDRMKSFNDSIEKLLWPERRKGNIDYVTASGKVLHGQVDVTTRQSYLRLPTGYLPDFLMPLAGILDRFLPWLFDDGEVEIGPIPGGTPVNLIVGIDMDQKAEVIKLLLKIKKDLKALPESATDEEATAVFADLKKPLLALAKCPDFIVNRGHYFGTGYLPGAEGEPRISDEDKLALIEFLKTM